MRTYKIGSPRAARPKGRHKRFGGNGLTFRQDIPGTFCNFKKSYYHGRNGYQ